MSKEGLQEKFTEFGNNLGNIVWLQIVQHSFMMLLPVIIVGSFAALFGGIDFGGYQGFIASTGIKDALSVLTQFTNDFLAVYLSFAVGYQYAQRHELRKEASVVALTALLVFFLVTPLGATEEGSFIPVEWLGSKGMFTALVTSFLIGGVFSFCKKNHWEIKLPEEVPPMVAMQLSSVIPVICSVVVALALRAVFLATPFASIHNAIYSIMRVPMTFLSTNIFGQWFMWTFAACMWFVGINGPMVILPILLSMFLPMQLENLAAFSAGQALPNIITGQGLDVGHGSLPFLIAMLIWSKSKANRTISKIAIAPSCFGIDEPAYFGLPMVMNPTFFLPWCIINPFIQNIGTYALQVVGLLPYATGANAGNFNLPFITNFVGYGWKGVVWGFVLLGLQVAVALPFVKAYDAKLVAEESEKHGEE